MLAFVITLLSYLCLVVMGGLVCLIVFKSRHRPHSHARLRRLFFLLVLCLLLWQLTLFLAAHTTLPDAQLYLGRANFAAIASAVYFVLRFVQEVAQRKFPRWLGGFLVLVRDNQWNRNIR